MSNGGTIVGAKSTVKFLGRVASKLGCGELSRFTTRGCIRQSLFEARLVERLRFRHALNRLLRSNKAEPPAVYATRYERHIRCRVCYRKCLLS